MGKKSVAASCGGSPSAIPLDYRVPNANGDELQRCETAMAVSVFPSHVPSRQSASRYWLRLLNGRGPVRNHMPEIAAMDLFVVPTLALNLLYGFIIVRLERI